MSSGAGKGYSRNSPKKSRGGADRLPAIVGGSAPGVGLRPKVRQVADQPAQPSSSNPNRPETGGARVLESSDLFAGDTKVFIRHANELYRLLKTKNGKLILQK
ncbi:MAG: hemin uptake protein HemP [Planctomycetota bacterium]